MKRGSKFLISFIAASLTFGSLMAFVGPQYSGFNRYGHRSYHGGWYHYHHYGDYYQDERHLPDESRRKKL